MNRSPKSSFINYYHIIHSKVYNFGAIGNIQYFRYYKCPIQTNDRMDAKPALLYEEVPEPSVSGSHSSARVIHGLRFSPQQQVLLYDSAEWERFTQEWVSGQRSKYTQVVRLSGSGDMGIDIAGLCDAKGFFGVWDNYQCKHENKPIIPTTAIVEIGKILWYSFNKEFAAPRKHYFIAPKDCGITLTKLLANPIALKEYVFENWDKYCKNGITDTVSIELRDDFYSYVDSFDFSIFKSKSTLEIIDEHRETPWHAGRFGGGLPDRPPVTSPPAEATAQESRYIAQLFEAYTDYKKTALSGLDSLSPWNDLVEHYHRQRELFYHAEALRNFARDTVPPGTFEDLQEEVHAGVIDIEAAAYEHGFARLTAVTQTAANLHLTSNALISVIKVQDRKGMCHQLANEDRLTWKK